MLSGWHITKALEIFADRKEKMGAKWRGRVGGRKERGIYAQSDEGAESGLKEDSLLLLSYPSREMARWRVTEGWRVAVLCWE